MLGIFGIQGNDVDLGYMNVRDAHGVLGIASMLHAKLRMSGSSKTFELSMLEL